MSDFEANDIDDELLELAGASDKKRKRHQSSSSKSKKRKADVSLDTDSEGDGPESEEEDVDPYPLEGKYVDDTDRQRLMQMSEVEREEIIAQRLEEMQRLHDKRMIAQMVKEQKNGEMDSVARAAKRQHMARGATKEKTRKLDELKAKRKAKDEKRQRKDSPSRRDRSSSPMDMEISDEESEDGQISKFEEEEERDRKLYSKPPAVEAQPATMEDFEKCRLSRDVIAKYCMAPWFQDFIQDAWVRYLIGQENGQPVYRICQVLALCADPVKPYKVNDRLVNQNFELKHGKSVRGFPMDKVSNSGFLLKEFDRLTKACAAEHVKLPSKQDLEAKAVKMHKLMTQPMTESDINAMLARKNQLQSQTSRTGSLTMEKSRLNQERTLALRRHDFEEVDVIDAKIAQLEARAGDRPVARRNEQDDMLAKVNERNRRANLEAVRRAEVHEAERKRKERKLAASGVSTPTTVDPSARLKTIPRVFNSATPSGTRPGTPSATGTPTLQPKATNGSRPVSPLPTSTLSASLTSGKSFEAAIIDSIEIDLGDF